MLGYLNGFAPAVNEKGNVTYGEVYLMLKGSKKSIVIKNVTSQGISAWIPIQDHVHSNLLLASILANEINVRHSKRQWSF